MAKLALLLPAIIAAAPYNFRLVRSAMQLWFAGGRTLPPAPVVLLAVTTGLTFAIAWSGWRSRLLGAMIFGAGTFAFFALQLTGGVSPNFSTLSMLLDSRDAAPDVLRLYPGPMAVALLLASATAIGIVLPPGTDRNRWAAPLVSVVLAVLALVAIRRDGRGLEGAAPGWAIPVYATLVLYDQVTTPSAAMLPALPAPGRRPRGDILILVDESIGGQYLDINAPAGARSGLAALVVSGRAANFGIAASATNFSVGSNFIMRTGGSRASYRQRRASIWAYAHRAGLRTVHLNAQNYAGLQNLMTPREQAEIDDAMTLAGVSRENKDHAAALILRRLLADDVPQLIYVNKSGAHFPAWTTYPRRAIIYRPALREIDNGRRIVNIADPGGRGAYRNDYRNAIAWNVGGFFDLLLRGGIPANTTIIYTSDHGEALGDRTPRQFGHGRVDDPAPEEGAVPLVVIPPAATVATWRRAAASGRGASHYQVFPTVLTLMGYNRQQVNAAFGPDLLSSQADPLTFNSRFYSLGGGKAAWHRIDRTRLMPGWR